MYISVYLYSFVYYILKVFYFKDILKIENKYINVKVIFKFYIKGIVYRGSF